MGLTKSPAHQRLAEAVELVHQTATMGTLLVDLIVIHVSNFQECVDAGDDPTVEIKGAFDKLTVLTNGKLEMPQSVRSYFSKAGGPGTCRFDPYEVEAANAHAAAYRVIEKVLRWGGDTALDVNAPNAPKSGCEYLRAVLDREVDGVRDALDYSPNDLEPSTAEDGGQSSTNDARDWWMYQEKVSGKTHGQIKNALGKDHTEWEQIESEQGIGRAIDRYCKRKEISLIRRKKNESP